jgi:ActR/RegA family two-component response regulator/anti-sigma regulatory factor (Ser/Thr protein kinase)
MGWQKSFSLLLAEDDEEVITKISAWAQLTGWEVAIVPPTFEAISKELASSDHEVLIIGLHSTSREGCDLLESLADKLSSIQVLVICPQIQDFGIVELIRHGAFDCLAKPLKEGSFARAMSRIEGDLEQSRISKSMYRFIKYEKTVFELLSRDLGNGSIPLEIAGRLYDDGYIDHSTRTRLVVAFQEALTNAHDHGNLELESPWKEEFDESGADKFSRIKAERLSQQEYGGRKLKIEILLEDFKLFIKIADDGKGCPKETRNAQKSPEQLLLAGRGISLMRWGADELVFNEEGNEVLMIKQLAKPI